ncbi:hypothetical protein HDV05_002030 [Chytridiales sp. JEL 0842]|nr:hypothetical protein HDV05_002030 [Chytridiales sp. JEL 0842]
MLRTILLALLAISAATLAVSSPTQQIPIVPSLSSKTKSFEKDGLVSPSSLGFSELLQIRSHPEFGIHIKSHPKGEGLCDPKSKEMTGYFEIPSGYLFFWFFESQSNPREDPFILWINGGPGCSSNLGLLMELGPCRPTPGGNATEPHPFGWNTYANLLFLDQPVDVGYSYSKEGKGPGDSTSAANEVDIFFQIFFQHYPNYGRNDMHVFGESYAGHYVPAIGKAIVAGNLNGGEERFQVKLKSVGIGNGWVNPIVQWESSPDMLCDTKYGPVVEESVCENMRSKYPTCKRLGDVCERFQTTLTCLPALTYCESNFGLPASAGRNYYDLRMKCGDMFDCYPILKDAEVFLNNPDVQKVLGVNRPFKTCSDTVSRRFVMTADGAKSYDGDVAYLLEEGVKVLVYNGDADYACHWMGNVAWLNKMEWSGAEGFRNAKLLPWSLSEEDGNASGEFRTFGNLTWLRIYEAGHMVPYDQPIVSLIMLTLWIGGATAFTV